MNAIQVRSRPAGRKRVLDRSEGWWAYALLAPSLVLFGVFVFAPMLSTLVISLTSWNLLTPAQYVGLDNYKTMLGDTQLRTVILNTLQFTVFTVLAKIILGLGFAFMVWKIRPRFVTALLESILFFPVILPMSIVTMVWGILLNTDMGAVNGMLVSVGLGRIPWLSEAHWALRSIMLLDVWKGLGFFFIVFLVALRNVPRELYEAASIDGAGPMATFTRITLPAISPTTLFLSVIATIGSLQAFDQSYILTRGGPGDATKTIVYYLWQNAFQYLNMGYGTTIALLLFAFIMLVTLIQFWASKRWVSYD